ncbi:gamma subclass chorismate mutase AroQ [Saccharopolyspora cebuensis]|uniref:chorismate mutase n=1 Tax=Saccharopolyspora cebuensis TaxID=418759 RepID=A0ABV4CMV8_9PSEU
MRRLLLAAATATFALVTTPAAAASGTLDPVLDPAADRIATADLVAAAKWGTGKPIEDPARERQVLDRVSRRAAELGVDPDVAVRVLRDQIEASKLVQRAWHGHWAAHPDQRPERRPDLGEVRPEIDRATEAILLGLRATAEVRTGPSCPSALAAAYHRTAEDLIPLHRLGLARASTSLC